MVTLTSSSPGLDISRWTLDADLPTLESARQCQSWLFFGSIRIVTQENRSEFNVSDYVDRTCPNKTDFTSLQSLPKPTTSTFEIFCSTLSKYSSWFRQVVNNLEVDSSLCNPWEHGLFNVFWLTAMLFKLMHEWQIGHNIDHQSFTPLYDS